MKSFFHFFAERSLLAYLITLIIILLGIGTATTIKRDSFPAVEFGELLITTQFPGASPEDVELKVTNEIEKELKKVTNIKRYLSWSMENVSSIYVVIEPEVDDEDKVIREIREAVSRVNDLPAEVTETPLVTELGTSSFPMIEIGLSGDVPYSELRELGRRFEKKLENVSGVSYVERYGYRAREIRVELLPENLNKHELSLVDIVSAIQARNIRATGGNFESYTSEKNIVTLAQFRSPEEVGDVIIKTTFDGPLIRIKDLAIVKDHFEDETVSSRVNGKNAISFIAFKTENSDIIRTVDKIKALIEKEKAILPDQVEILVSNDSSKYVRNKLGIVVTNGIIGLTLVMIVLTLFLNLRLAFWVAMGIPVSILGVVFLLPVFDTFLDSVTMTAMVLVIGIVVDDAIIIAENIHRYQEQGLSPVDAAVKGVSGVYRPVLTTILTTMVVFAPLFFMPGMLGKFVYVIPLVVTLALAVSLIESTLALPAHLVHGKPASNNQGGQYKTRMYNALRQYYQYLFGYFIRFRYLLIAGFIIVLSSSLFYAAKYMDFVLFPSSNAEQFMILIETPIGSSLKATSDKAREIETVINAMERSELDSYVTRIGTFGDMGSSERENNASIFVNLTPFSNRTRTADEIVDELKATTQALSGFEKLTFAIESGGPPVGRPIMIRVVGPDDTLRKKLADDVLAYLNTIEGAQDLDRDDKPGKQQLEIKLDYAMLARVGITVADVAQNVRIAYDGEVVTNVRYGDEDVDFRVIFSEAVRKNPERIRQLQIPNQSGRLTTLEKLGHLESSPGPANIVHYKGDRSITVSGDVDKRIITPIKISSMVREHFDVDRDYPGLRLVIGGEAEESEKSLNELFIIMGIAIIGIYFLLILLFNSLWQPFLVMVAMPFGVIGVIVGFAIHDVALGFLAMTGIIGLAGVVVNDSLVLVNHINELRINKPHRPLQEVLAEGTSNRLRAILLTTISTVAGLLPLADGIGGSDPYMGPMALALGWGLLFATPLTLILLPCLYMVGDDIRKLFVRARGGWKS
ncbi:MAG: efflux RND transporter permease subunit, partial [Gammaproteobacteria bacterium]